MVCPGFKGLRIRGGALGSIRISIGMRRGGGERLGVRSILTSMGSVMFLRGK